MEVWKDVKGFEGLYQVSSIGNVRGIGEKQKKGNKKLYLDDGMRYVTRLSKDGKTKTAKVHRLVAEAFVPNPNNMTTVTFLDGNSLNLNYTNLIWCNDYHEERGKTCFKSNVEIKQNKTDDFETVLLPHFFQSFASSSLSTLP